MSAEATCPDAGEPCEVCRRRGDVRLYGNRFIQGAFCRDCRDAINRELLASWERVGAVRAADRDKTETQP